MEAFGSGGGESGWSGMSPTSAAAAAATSTPSSAPLPKFGSADGILHSGAPSMSLPFRTPPIPFQVIPAGAPGGPSIQPPAPPPQSSPQAFRYGGVPPPTQVTSLAGPLKRPRETDLVPSTSSQADMELELSIRGNLLVQQQRRIAQLEKELQIAWSEVEKLRQQVTQFEQDKMRRDQRPQQPQSRYWTPEEHQRFLEALKKFGHKNVKAISAYVSTRNPTQVRTHAQKYYLRLARESQRARGWKGGDLSGGSDIDDGSNPDDDVLDASGGMPPSPPIAVATTTTTTTATAAAAAAAVTARATTITATTTTTTTVGYESPEEEAVPEPEDI